MSWIRATGGSGWTKCAIGRENEFYKHRQGSGKQVEHFRPSFHGMNDQLVPAVKDEHHGLKQTPLPIETEPQLPGRRIGVQVFDPDRPGCCMS